MELGIDMSRRFEKDMKKLPDCDREVISKNIELLSSAIDLKALFDLGKIFKPFKIFLAGGLDSSLYVLRISMKWRIIFTIDEDPIFNEKTITLMRVVKADDMELAFKSVAESLYQEFKMQIEE